MGSYSVVKRRIWRSTSFRKLNQGGKLLYLYLLTSPHTNILQCYYCPKQYMARDIGWSVDRVAKALGHIAHTPLGPGRGGLIAWDNEAEVVLLRNGLAEDPPAGKKQIAAIHSIVGELPYSPLIFEELYAILENLGPDYQCALHTLSQRYPQGMDGQSPPTPIPIPEPLPDKEPGTETDGDAVPKVSAREMREAWFSEIQNNHYPREFDRHLSGETTGRRAYVNDLKEHASLGFAKEEDLHAHVLEKIGLAKSGERWQEQGGKYVPGLGKFFKDRLWRGEFGKGGSAALSRAGLKTAQAGAQILEEMYAPPE